MSRSLTRKTPLTASCLLLASFLFATIELGEGLTCYNCVSGIDSNCAQNPSASSTVECPPSTVKPVSFLEERRELEPLLPFLKPDTYADDIIYGCLYVRFLIRNDTEDSEIVLRTCNPMNFMTCDTNISISVPIKSFEIAMCTTDHCNSAGMMQIGVITLLLSLVASLFYTK